MARQEAILSDHKQKHGAVVYHRNKILGAGHNQCKTHPRAHRFYKYPFIHAELDSVIRAKTSVHNCTVAVVRVNNEGELMHSKPCDECLHFLKKQGIVYVVYSSHTGINKMEI
jgi:deoxycytidylate deaminase